MRASTLALAAIALVGCKGRGPAPTSVAATTPTPPTHSVVAALSAAAPAPPIHFIEDDIAAATAMARAEGKALFIETWAPWCHACLSMKNFVLGDPALRPLASRVVFATVDTDREVNAAFLDKYAVHSLPTFLILDPTVDKVVGYWSGTVSVREIRDLIGDALATMGGTAKDPASHALGEARAAHAAGDLTRAARAYEQAIASSTPAWSGKSSALLAWIETLASAKAWGPCTQLGLAHLHDVTGASAPADFASVLLACADKVSPGPEQDTARSAAVERLRELTAHPSADASVDDRQDALDVLANGLEDLGDAAGARKAQEDRLRLLEHAAAAATTVDEAQTFDYARAGAYVALGRAEDAVKMLAQRERELPEAYEPPARLSGVLFKMGRLPEALAAINRAISRSYGPRKLEYLKARADVQTAAGDRAAAIASVKEEVKGYEALPAGQGRPGKLSDAFRRLGELERAGSK